MSTPSRGRGSKVDAATPVSSDFWEQFVREWGVIKYVAKVYSEFRGAMGVRDLAVSLLQFSNLMLQDKEVEKKDTLQKAKGFIDKLKPLISWLDVWMHECLELPIYNEQGLFEGTRKIGFYHVRRQNIMPVGFEMRVVLEGFDTPVLNAEYAEMRSYALYGYEEDGKRIGGVKNICVKMEALFHYIIGIMGQTKIFFREETMVIGDEEQQESNVAEEEGRDLLLKEVDRLRQLGKGDIEA